MIPTWHSALVQEAPTNQTKEKTTSCYPLSNARISNSRFDILKPSLGLMHIFRKCLGTEKQNTPST